MSDMETHRHTHSLSMIIISLYLQMVIPYMLLCILILSSCTRPVVTLRACGGELTNMLMEHCAEYKRSPVNDYASLTAHKRMDALKRQEMENWSQLESSRKSDNKVGHLTKDLDLMEQELSNKEKITKGTFPGTHSIVKTLSKCYRLTLFKHYFLLIYFVDPFLQKDPKI